MKRFLLTLITIMSLSISLFALEIATPADIHYDVAVEKTMETPCESESSNAQPIWDDLYTHLSVEFSGLKLTKISSDDHFNFYYLKKEIFRPPWMS